MDKFQESTMELNAALSDTIKSSGNYLRCLIKAIDRTHQLLAQEGASQDYDQIHSAKSILYAALEQMGMRGERIFTTQRMLRELLSIATTQYQSPGHDKQVGLQILDELKNRTQTL